VLAMEIGSATNGRRVWLDHSRYAPANQCLQVESGGAQAVCHIESNWAGQPLTTYETVLKFARTTHTDTGLHCRAYLDKAIYQTGLKITKTQKAQINLRPGPVLPRRNFTIRPHNRVRKTEK
jgi:hypothetical protein